MREQDKRGFEDHAADNDKAEQADIRLEAEGCERSADGLLQARGGRIRCRRGTPGLCGETEEGKEAGEADPFGKGRKNQTGEREGTTAGMGAGKGKEQTHESGNSLLGHYGSTVPSSGFPFQNCTKRSE